MRTAASTKRCEIPIPRLLRRLDMFGKNIPSFNISGQERMYTAAGGLFSLMIFSVVFIFGAQKMVNLVSRRNPTVNTYVEPNFFMKENTFAPFKEKSFQMAFLVESYLTRQAVTDPRYVKYQATYLEYKNEVKVNSILIPTHPCTEADFEKFYPVDVNSETKLAALKRDKQLLCMEAEDLPIELYGTEAGGDYGVISINLMPCNARSSPFGLIDDVPEDCIGDLR